ncbi:hypothetical protein BOTNAR_0043g00230 [Botryotinia narcissicola]|uniref:Uncharacterized protein n=1 Tax=Botryotinia narcissicola TaxID=278944 RepID=A0A4Z1J181_9HELO|nr:hypothetical protein BOTNAR_0043g00230 [Botryotinia narcissicola]
MSNRSGHQNVKTEHGSSASEDSSIDPKELPCYNLSPGNHFTTGTYPNNHKTKELRGRKNYACELSSRCSPVNSLKEIQKHIQDHHMEKLCGFIGHRDVRREHVDTSECHRGSERRKKRDDNLAYLTKKKEQARFEDGEERRMRYEEEDRLRMSRNGRASGASGGSAASGGRRRV